MDYSAMGVLLGYCETPWSMGVWIPSLFATTFNLPNHVVRQFGLFQDALEDTFVSLLRGSILHPSTVVAFSTTWYKSV